MPLPMPDIILTGIELLNDLGLKPGRWDKDSLEVRAIEAAQDGRCNGFIERWRHARGDENPSTKADSPPPDVCALISTSFRTLILAPQDVELVAP